MGGCGDYFEAADTVIMMRDYLPHDATDQARAVAGQRTRAPGPHFGMGPTSKRHVNADVAPGSTVVSLAHNSISRSPM